MLYAVFRRSPVSDGQVESYADEEALKVPGVRAVYPLSNERHGGRVILPNSPNFVSGVAVLADTTWAAMQGAKVLQIKWRNPPELDDTGSLYAAFTAGLDTAAVQVRRDGDPENLIEAINQHKLPIETYNWYIDLRRFGTVPHSGFGLGLERTVAWICGIAHIRETSPFPRTLLRMRP